MGQQMDIRFYLRDMNGANHFLSQVGQNIRNVTIATRDLTPVAQMLNNTQYDHYRILLELNPTLIRQNNAIRDRLGLSQLAKVTYAQEVALNQVLNAIWKEQLDLLVEDSLLLIQNDEAHYSADERRQAGILLMERENAMIQQNVTQMHHQRRMILGNTMAFFGLTMTMWQITNAGSAFSRGNEELQKSFQQLQGVLMGMTAPMLLYNGILQMINSTQWKVAKSAMFLMAAFTAVFFAYKALHAEGKKTRAIFSILAGVATALAIAVTGLTMATNAANTAKIIQRALASGGGTLAIDAAIVASALAIGTGTAAALYAMGRKGQTAPNQYREIEKTGIIVAHQGELLGRITPAKEMGGKSIIVHNIIQLDGRTISESVERQRELDEYTGGL